MLARDGYSTILVVFIFSGVVGWGATFLPYDWMTYTVFGILVLLCGLILYFFRDPKREIPEGENLIISPADGKIVLIQEADEKEFVKDKVTQISIFLSPLDVHVNRNPLSGSLDYVKYYPGKYLMAWEDHASLENERAHFGVTHKSGYKMMFKQITGFLARRIVYHIEEGDQLHAGERFGIMKFGSRMDLMLPEGVEILVNKGERTVAGETVIGKIVK